MVNLTRAHKCSTMTHITSLSCRSVSRRGLSQCLARELDWRAVLNVTDILHVVSPLFTPHPHPPGGMRQAKLLILHTRTYTHSCQPWFIAPHAFCVQMRHIQRLLIYKETAHPVLCPASIKSVWEGGGEEGTGLQTDLKTTALSCSVWQSSTLAAQANGRYHRHYIADAH